MDENTGFLPENSDDLVQIDNIQEDGQETMYDYVQSCYIENDISLDIFGDVWQTVDFLASTASACDYSERNEYFSYYDNQYGFEVDNAHANGSENVSDEEEIEEDENLVGSDVENQTIEPQITDTLDIDRLLEAQLKRLNLSRQTRRRNRRKHNIEKNSILLSGLIQKANIEQTVSIQHENDKNLQTEMGDPSVYNSIFTECCDTLSRIASAIPESNDDLDDYRLANSMYCNMMLMKSNKELNWKVDSLGKCLKRALNELCLFRIALQNTVGDLRNEIEMLRKNTLSTIRRIIQGDITRREQMQQNWEEVQNYIRMKNRRIAELTEKLNGADLEVSFLLASHKNRIESACIAERNFFRASERLEDLELELKKKRCVHCETNSDSSAQEKVDQEEILKRREEKRKQFEDNEKQQFACAERYGKAIQQHFENEYQDLKNSNLPWHENMAGKQNGQPIPVLHQRVAQPTGQFFPNKAMANSDQKVNPNDQLCKPGFVPFEVFQLTRMRCEEMEKDARKQERMNEILSRDLTDTKSTMTKLKAENSTLKSENEKMITENDKLKAFYQMYRKNGKIPLTNGLETPPDSNSDKSKDDSNNLPKPPTPPEFLEKSPLPKAIKDSPSEPRISNKRKLNNNNERKVDHQVLRSNITIKNESIKQHLMKPTSSKADEFFGKDNSRKAPENPPQYFASRSRRSVSPEPKRPAFGLLPPPLMPPQRAPPLFHKEQNSGRPDHAPPPLRDRQFYDDSLSDQPAYRSFSPPNLQRRDLSPPSPQFEPMNRPQESWNGRRLPGPRPPNWQPPQLRGPPRGMYLNDIRPSLRPPQISPTPPMRSEIRPRPMNPDIRPMNAAIRPMNRPWHGGMNLKNMRPPPQIRSTSTSWINHSFSRR